MQDPGIEAVAGPRNIRCFVLIRAEPKTGWDDSSVSHGLHVSASNPTFQVGEIDVVRASDIVSQWIIHSEISDGVKTAEVTGQKCQSPNRRITTHFT